MDRDKGRGGGEVCLFVSLFVQCHDDNLPGMWRQCARSRSGLLGSWLRAWDAAAREVVEVESNSKTIIVHDHVILR